MLIGILGTVVRVTNKTIPDDLVVTWSKTRKGIRISLTASLCKIHVL